MLNLDFQLKVTMNTNDMGWQPSPAIGVLRKPLAREDRERGHATSMVKYESGSSFKSHQHPGGEEILVLEGVLSDEHGDYGKGAYLRNPPGTSHAPFSEDGCTLFVKLHQFSDGDNKQVAIDTSNIPWTPGIGGLEVMPLHEFESEHVALVRWPSGERFQPHRHAGGEEILVLSGCLRDEYGIYPAGTWIRSPDMSEHYPYVEEDTVIWVKTGHLAAASPP